ncbi:hypothetical protein BACFIN_07665 [Bacteroides finegoldii DSM 17565]|nr:hypothetical protein BACFIN_07665 [Bacteroides finegoldii DSM 17565]
MGDTEDTRNAFRHPIRQLIYIINKECIKIHYIFFLCRVRSIFEKIRSFVACQ